jgi:TolA-binding protein
MTRFSLRPADSAGFVRSALARSGPFGEKRSIFVAVLLSVAAPGCLPGLGKAPAKAAVSAEPSELETLRADNAELSRRVHELRAEKVELKRRLAQLEQDDAPSKAAPAAASVSTASALPVVELDEAAQPGLDASRPALEPNAAPRPVAEAPVLISGLADAADFDLGRAALEAGSYQNADVTLSRFLAHNPRHPFADDALVLRGRARAGRQQFDAAERDFRLVADRYPEELVAPDAWLELVRLRRGRGDDPGAREASQVLLARYPDSVAASQVPQEFLE